MNRAVFVPAIMSAGLLFSVVTLLRDLVGRSGHRGRLRRAEAVANAVVADALGTDARPEAVGMRPRNFYLIVAVAALGAMAYLVPGAILNYAAEGGYVADIAWLLGLSLVAALVLGFVGGVAATTWVRWPSPPWWVRPVLQRSPLGGPAIEEGEPVLAHPSVLLSTAVVAVTAALAVVTIGVAGLRSSFVSADHRVAEVLVDADLPGWATAYSHIGDTRVSVLVALVIGIAALRCRTLAAAWIAAVVVALGVDAALKALVERPRPDGPLAGLEDSFPSGHVVQLTVLAVVAPLAVLVINGRRWPARAVGAMLAVGAALAAVERVHDATHWPTDVVGGLLLGAAAGLGVRWAVAHEEWHGRCRGCPWRRPSEGPAPPVSGG